MPAILRLPQINQLDPNACHWLRLAEDLLILKHFEPEIVRFALSEGYLKQKLSEGAITDTVRLVNVYQILMNWKDPPLEVIPLLAPVRSYIDAAIDTILEQRREYRRIDAHLNTVLGSEHVLSCVRAEHGHYIQNLVIYDKAQMTPVIIERFKSENEMDFIRLEDVPRNENEIRLASYFEFEPHDRISKNFAFQNRD